MDTTTPHDDQLALPFRRDRRAHRSVKPGFAAALAIVVKVGREQCSERTCPRCGHTGPVGRDFGFRVLRGQRRAQSWCRACRRAAPAEATPPSQLRGAA